MNEAQPNKLTPSWRKGGPLTPDQRKAAKALFIDALEDEGNVSDACDHANISRDSVYRWVKQDKKFAKAWETAIERSNDHIRSSLFMRAVKGVETFVVSHGSLVYIPTGELDEDGKKIMTPLVEKKYSDSLMSLLAKSRMAEFREKQQLEHSGTIETKRNPDLSKLTDEELDQLAALLLKAEERRNA